MLENTHALTGRLALLLFREYTTRGFSRRQRENIIHACIKTDAWEDVEFVDVQGGRDDPHRRRWLERHDQAHTSTNGVSHTGFNHFIDLRKGQGRFDDYDGYSYARGSAGKGEYQPARQAAQGWPKVLSAVTGQKVDEAIAYWFNDEYVHVPGRLGYRHCSPAMEHYSFPRDLGRYSNKQAELLARFPLAASRGKKNRGFPYSVFMPLDNLARYWFGKYEQSQAAECLGPVLHAVGDASIPHHAAGTCGNWHWQYEHALAPLAQKLSGQPAFHHSVRWQVERWLREDPRPPKRRLESGDRELRPARNWPVQQLITWLAWQALTEYRETYHDFRQGFRPNAQSMFTLYTLAVSLSVLMLVKSGDLRQEGS